VRIVSGFLIVRADGDMRVVKKTPYLDFNEVAFHLKVSIPDAWAKVQGDVNIELPEPPPAEVTVELVEPA
jgi:hypothetical protein